MFDISSIPENQIINNASLCMYLYDDTDGGDIIYTYHLYNNSWCEGNGGSDNNPICEITWNNQPCGTNFDNSNQCNLTYESSLTTDTTLDDTWQCWNIKNMLSKEYQLANNNLSIAIVTNESGNADKFRSKEYTDPNLAPYINITYSLANNIPLVSSISLIPPSPKTNDDLTCTFTVIDLDENDSLTANITWYQNGAVYSSVSQPVTNGTQTQSILDSSNTAKTEQWNCTVIPYDGTSYGNQNSSRVVIQNSPPTAPNISLTPTSPYTNNDLNIVFNQVSQDNDSDSITYTYKWYKDNVLQPGLTTSTVSNGLTSKNEVWKVNVTPNDGTENGESTLKNVTILNSKPSITSASISPTNAYETTTLTASASGWSDLDGESANYIYQWFNQNGQIPNATLQTLTGAYFNKTNQIYLNVTPYDSDEYGNSELTNTVTIQNSPPTITQLELATNPPFNTTDDDLQATFIVTDTDNDSITQNETKWFKDNTEQTSYINQTTIDSSNTNADEEWVFSVRSYDGQNWSIWYNSSTLTIQESPAVPRLISPSNNSYMNESSVILTYRTPNTGTMNCSIYVNESFPPTTIIKTNNNLAPTTVPTIR